MADPDLEEFPAIQKARELFEARLRNNGSNMSEAASREFHQAVEKAGKKKGTDSKDLGRVKSKANTTYYQNKKRKDHADPLNAIRIDIKRTLGAAIEKNVDNVFAEAEVEKAKKGTYVADTKDVEDACWFHFVRPGMASQVRTVVDREIEIERSARHVKKT
uniref:Uncharacterized protein n=1 Tax=Mucochytrium quahogii TaxID=96639 RepID=A0A7S2WFN3_9STRA|mmetsp:Transcript_19364/g.31875  ORF Transcript_19364/g.31875 Transcript_19364/m.31875 type:complete len:161 (-) Transcript_19364:295-777(-)